MSASHAASPSSVSPSSSAASTRIPVPEAEVEVLRAIRDTRFGTVEVVVHQSRIVQITRSEKLRFER